MSYLNREQAISQLADLIQHHGPAFHPDNEIADYVGCDGDLAIPPAEALEQQRMLDECWDVLDEDIYDESLRIIQEKFNPIGTATA